jgi:diaminopropionate ammonia-lyase
MDIQYQRNQNRQSSPSAEALAVISPDKASGVLRFHQSLPGYRPTPLLALPGLARRLTVADIRVKDESARFDLKAFKVLGASYAIAREVAQRAGIDPAGITFDRISSAAAGIDDLTFVTATDGNHGRAVAWTAKKLGCRAVVYLPAGSSRHRLTAIRQLGAEAEIVEGNFDAAVRYAARSSRQYGWTLMQDTAWDGYAAIPLAIMQGYTTLLSEAYRQLADNRPTHIFVQAGVGSLAAAMMAFVCRFHTEPRPFFAVVEPAAAACFHRSATIGDGKPHPVLGSLNTLMAGLSCGEPSRIAWPILSKNADGFVVCPDRVAVDGMRMLAAPAPGDPSVVSGESGAVTAGLVAELLGNPALKETARQMGLDAGSRILLLSTEGDTDPHLYRRMVAG